MKGAELLKDKQPLKNSRFQASTALNGFLVFGEFLLREREIQSALCIAQGWL